MDCERIASLLIKCIHEEEKVANIVTSVVERLRQNKPEKTLVQQMAEKHGTQSVPITNPFTNNYVQPRVPPLTQALEMAKANKSTDNILNNVNETEERLNENISKIANQQKEKINEELTNIGNSNVVSNAKAKFQGLMKKAISKEELKNVTTKIVNNAVSAGEKAITDVEMGIIQTTEELKNDNKKDE